MNDKKFYELIGSEFGGGDEFNVNFENREMWENIGFLKGVEESSKDELCRMYGQIAIRQLREELDKDERMDASAVTTFPFAVSMFILKFRDELVKLASDPDRIMLMSKGYLESNQDDDGTAKGCVMCVWNELLSKLQV